MDYPPLPILSRRTLLKALAALPFGVLVAARSEALALTPEIPDDDDDLTPSQTEGPYFKPKSPERKSLREASVKGTALVVAGRILGQDKKPVAKALVEFWHCDAAGNYDNEGFKLRGHQYTDEHGAYRLETIVPGLYPGRTRHIHVKVQAPKARVLTTQLYFPADTDRNRRDGIYDARLLMKVSEKDGVQTGGYDFVVKT